MHLAWSKPLCFFWALPLLFRFCSTPAALAANPFTQYPVEFPDPNLITTGHFDNARFAGAKASIVQWATDTAAQGPWSVTSKPAVAPSGDKHDYMSWAPYQWPDCSGVGNTTALSPPEMWVECQYVFRGGQVNPDRSTVNDSQYFALLSDAVLYNSIASTFTNDSSSVYSQNVAKFIDVWFLDADTGMNPNLIYAQMDRGPNGQIGEYTGILDLRGFSKIASAILILRKTKNSDWTADLDAKMTAWCKSYIQWLNTSASGKKAAVATNNHGTIFGSQMAGLKLIVNDLAGAADVAHGYFEAIYRNQINSTGDQPEEASRTRPFHYRNFNMAGMITNARLLSYADATSTPWNETTTSGATIRTALDFLMTVDPAATAEQDRLFEMYTNVAAVASAYGDPAGKYVNFLKASEIPYADEPTVLCDAGLDLGLRAPPAPASANAALPSNVAFFAFAFLFIAGYLVGHGLW